MRFHLWHHKPDHAYTQLATCLFPFDFDHFRHILTRKNGSSTTRTSAGVFMPECWTLLPQDILSIIESYLYTLQVEVCDQYVLTSNGKWVLSYVACDVDLFPAILQHPLIQDCVTMLLLGFFFFFF